MHIRRLFASEQREKTCLVPLPFVSRTSHEFQLDHAYPSAKLRLTLRTSSGRVYMDSSERRNLTRYAMRTPIRFKAMGLAADKSEHFTEALNVSQGGFYFATSAPLQIGMPIEATSADAC